MQIIKMLSKDGGEVLTTEDFKELWQGLGYYLEGEGEELQVVELKKRSVRGTK